MSDVQEYLAKMLRIVGIDKISPRNAHPSARRDRRGRLNPA
ncbi:hypothetical protein ACIQWZ_36120 [Streptomyces sp. NPDC098077]